MNDELLLLIGYVDRWGEGRLYMCIDGGETRAWVCGSTPPCRSFAGGVLKDADEKRTTQHFDLLFARDTSNGARLCFVLLLLSIMRLGSGRCSVIRTCQRGLQRCVRVHDRVFVQSPNQKIENSDLEDGSGGW